MGTISLLRRGFRINTDWFPKWAPRKEASRGVWGMLPQKIFLGFQLPKVFWVIQTGYLLSAKTVWQISTWKKKILLWKIWPISIKQWKWVWIHAWCYSLRDFRNCKVRPTTYRNESRFSQVYSNSFIDWNTFSERYKYRKPK